MRGCAGSKLPLTVRADDGDVDLQRRSGGIGRRAGLKIRYPRGCEGSIPSFGTTIQNDDDDGFPPPGFLVRRLWSDRAAVVVCSGFGLAAVKVLAVAELVDLKHAGLWSAQGGLKRCTRHGLPRR